MRLERLSISLETYGPNIGQYTGTVKFHNQYGDVTVALDSGMSKEVLAICAGALVANAKELATKLTASVIENAGVQVLEHKED